MDTYYRLRVQLFSYFSYVNSSCFKQSFIIFLTFFANYHCYFQAICYRYPTRNPQQRKIKSLFHVPYLYILPCSFASEIQQTNRGTTTVKRYLYCPLLSSIIIGCAFRFLLEIAPDKTFLIATWAFVGSSICIEWKMSLVCSTDCWHRYWDIKIKYICTYILYTNWNSF